MHKGYGKSLKDRILPQDFYARDAKEVAIDLLGKILVRRYGRRFLKVKIVETEAYYGHDDPASRAYQGKITRISKVMYEEPGITLIYMVHGGWLMNIVTGKKGDAQAVLIRAGEPIGGIDLMKKFRKKDNLKDLTTGPAKLTEALKITKEHHMIKVFDYNSPVFVIEGESDFEVCSSGRIGVKRDLPEPLRFYIKGNEFVSKIKF